jgi:osmotically-inducible protein OsmY
MKLPFLTGGVLGAALMYFLDPDSGSVRRTKLRPITQKVAETQKRAAPVASGAYGTVKEKVGHKPNKPDPDDATVRDRVESEVFRDQETSREHINVNVVDGIVELRGEQSSQDDIDNLVKTVRSIANVKDVHNDLHLSGTPAPNKASAIQKS